ncbi:MAG: hypothetical protein ABSG64_12325 [Solirubrobacteraceae bacterium]|jgi:hypothetical protein
MNLGQFYEARPVATLCIGITGEERGRIVMASAALARIVREGLVV